MSWGKPCRQVGPYKISGSSAAVEGEHDAIFYEDVKFVTLRTTDAKLVEAMGLAGCNLKRDIKIKISTTGCARWKRVAACRADHDLLAIDAVGDLLFGVRPADNDMCTPDKRLKVLLSAVVSGPTTVLQRWPVRRRRCSKRYPCRPARVL